MLASIKELVCSEKEKEASHLHDLPLFNHID
jgi:hypothetical protein